MLRRFRAGLWILAHHFQLLRLRCDRIISTLFWPERFRILATACWNFPIYSQTFVYQELTQLIHTGFQLRFIYSKQDSRKFLPAQFSKLWSARRRLLLQPQIWRWDFSYFQSKMPEKVENLIR